MRQTALLLSLSCAAAVAGCEQDVVYPGYYGEPRQDSYAVMSGAGGAGAAGRRGLTSQGNDGVGATGGAPAGGGGDVGGAPGGQEDPMPTSPCDLAGRWLVTLHSVTDAIGQLQTAHRYLYYEITNEGGVPTLTKGLLCGNGAVAEGAFAVNADFHGAWEQAMRRVNFLGRGLSSTPSAGGCDVRFDRWYTVLGATVPHYTDPSIPMPGPDEQASGNTPGWEDWDGDGNPGITGFITGTIIGKVFVAPRQWTELSGTVADTSAFFRLKLHWDQEYNMLGYDGSPLLTSQAVRAANPDLHFGEFARLLPDEATGDDDAICAAVRELAPALTPDASAI